MESFHSILQKILKKGITLPKELFNQFAKTKEGLVRNLKLPWTELKELYSTWKYHMVISPPKTNADWIAVVTRLEMELKTARNSVICSSKIYQVGKRKRRSQLKSKLRPTIKIRFFAYIYSCWKTTVTSLDPYRGYLKLHPWRKLILQLAIENTSIHLKKLMSILLMALFSKQYFTLS